MATLVLGPTPRELTAFLERRQALGQDRFDEVWEGVYHVAPAPGPWHGYAQLRIAEHLSDHAATAGLTGTGPFNLGDPDDYRVPDLGYHRDLPTSTFVPTAAIVVEVVSPDDQTYVKLPFFAARAVDEVLIVDAAHRAVRWLIDIDGDYVERDASALLGVTAEALVEMIRWPD